MSKKQAQPVQATKRDEQPKPANDGQERPPANDAPAAFDMSGHTDAQLHATINACLTEIKTRKDAALAKLPPIGANVRITGDSKWKGKTGELVSRGKTRCHVRLDDKQFPLPAYVLIGEVEVVAAT